MEDEMETGFSQGLCSILRGDTLFPRLGKEYTILRGKVSYLNILPLPASTTTQALLLQEVWDLGVGVKSWVQGFRGWHVGIWGVSG